MEFLHDARRLPDLVIADLNIPGKSGIEIAREITLNPNFSYIKVVVLSFGFGINSFDTKRSGRGGSPFSFQNHPQYWNTTHLNHAIRYDPGGRNSALD